MLCWNYYRGDGLQTDLDFKLLWWVYFLCQQQKRLKALLI